MARMKRQPFRESSKSINFKLLIGAIEITPRHSLEADNDLGPSTL